MLFRANKKYSREVSLYEPIGVDKDGESVTLVDVVEMDNREILDTIILSQDVKELYDAYDKCLKDNEKWSSGCDTASSACRKKRSGRSRRCWAYPGPM